jgi:nucleotide-binding universal stress UspA family protein
MEDLRTSLNEFLVPTDLAETTDHAVAHAVFLAKKLGARLLLYHVVEYPDHRYPHWAFAHQQGVWHEAERQASELLGWRANGLGVPCGFRVERAASVPRAIATQIQTTNPGLTIMATHARTGLGHAVLGSVTEQVLQGAFRPVLCVRRCQEKELACRRILVPTDGSAVSRQVLPMTRLLAETFAADVILLSVLPHGEGDHRSRGLATSTADLRAAWQPDLPKTSVTARVQTGAVWHSIVEVARSERVDLIAMATRGHDSLSDKILGSNTERVVRHAPCAVLVA